MICQERYFQFKSFKRKIGTQILKSYRNIYVDQTIHPKKVHPAMGDKYLPKATMVNFIKDRIQDKRKVSAEFTNLMLQISKDYIDKVSAKANMICESEGKKTISNEHLFKALTELKMGGIIPHLQKIDQNIKIKNQKKQEVKQQVQRNIDRVNSEREALNEDERQKQKLEEQIPILIGTKKSKDILVIQQQQDFAEMIEDDDQDNEE